MQITSIIAVPPSEKQQNLEYLYRAFDEYADAKIEKVESRSRRDK